MSEANQKLMSHLHMQVWQTSYRTKSLFVSSGHAVYRLMERIESLLKNAGMKFE